MLSCPMNDARLVQIFRYPIKSMMGESLESAQITDNGLVGDRASAVREDPSGLLDVGCHHDDQLVLEFLRLHHFEI